MQKLSHHRKRWAPPTLDLRSAKTAAEIVKAIATARSLSLDDYVSTWTFPDTNIAIERMQRAVKNNERIGIFGDYDCDGVTGTALLVRALKRRNARPMVKLPHRAKEGYGIKTSHIEEFAKNGVTLLVTIDTGISAAKEVELAREKGIDVIILDHHHVPEDRAKPLAALHPSLVGAWKGAKPAAAGVVWAFVRAWEEAEHTPWPTRDEDLVLAALGTIADLVELRDGNRELVQEGLLALSRIKEGPLAELAAQADIKGSGTARDWGFRLAPRINAAGRMDDPMIALKAVLGDRGSLAELQRLNTERQDVVREHWDALKDASEDSFLLMTSLDYTPGIVGLIAGKLTEKFGRPSLVGSIQEGKVTASLRSVADYDVTGALSRVSDLLLSFGGHAKAAGCTFMVEKTEELRARLNKDLLERVDPESLLPQVMIDAVLEPEQITRELGKTLMQLEPHGMGNEMPRFLFSGVQLEDVRTMGGDSAHLQAQLGDARVIGFGLGTLAKKLAEEKVDLAGQVKLSMWRGEERLEVFLEDVRMVENEIMEKEEAKLSLE